MLKHIWAWSLFFAILCMAFWIRIQGVDTIPEGQFTSNDAYFYYWQAQIVSEQGHLPPRDMQRWVPLGRDNTQLLSLYPYVVAYTHKIITLLFPNILLYHVMLYTPPFCFMIVLGALCIFLYRMFGVLFSSTFGVLLATLPGIIDRSSAGFSDRDSWCLMLGVIAVITYLSSMQMPDSRKRLFFTLSSGATTFLGGISWEGFGVFVGIIIFIEIWRFLSTEIDSDLKYYLLWVLTFVPTLYLISPAYRKGEYFAQHLFAFVLIPPFMLLLIRYIRHILITKGTLAASLRPHTRKLSLILTAISVIAGILYIFIQSDTFALSALPLIQNHLMQSVTELKTPGYGHWVFRYGSIFFLGCIGLIIVSIHLWNKKSFVSISAIALFTATTFFREHVDKYWGTSIGNILFWTSIASTVFGLLLIAWFRKEYIEHEYVFIAFTLWFLYWIALSRDAMRYDFFVGIPIALFTASLLRIVSETLSVKLNFRGAFQMFIKTGITVVFLALLMFWVPAGGHAKLAIFTARHARTASPGYSSLQKALSWMKVTLPNTACIAANWNDGSQLNVLGGVKTIIDQDHYIQHWIHLLYRHVLCAQSETEALEFLKTHEATHIMLTEQDLFQLSPVHSSIASNEDSDRFFNLTPILIRTSGGKSFLVPHNQDSSLIRIDTHPNSESNTVTTIATLKKENNTKKKVEIPHTIFIGKTRIHSQKTTGSEIGGIVLFFNVQKQFRGGYYIPPIGWNSLAVRLFFRGESSEIFVPVYPEDGDVTAEVKVWEIRYPLNVKSNPKYLETKPPE